MSTTISTTKHRTIIALAATFGFAFVLGLVAAAIMPRLAADQIRTAQGSRVTPAQTGDTLAASADLPALSPRLEQRVLKLFPGVAKVDSIAASAMPGLYEVVIGGSNIFYIDASGKYLVRGDLIDGDNRVNLTEQRTKELTAVDFDKLPLSDAIKTVHGNGKRTIAVFTDPNCPYCKRFEMTLQDLKDATIYTFVMPILGADSTKKAQQIWCSENKSAAYEAWMVKATAPSGNGTCDTTALDRNVAFAHEHKITGTPTVFFANGERVPGIMSSEQLEAKIR